MATDDSNTVGAELQPVSKDEARTAGTTGVASAFLDFTGRVFYPLYTLLEPFQQQQIESCRTGLQQANISEPVELYISRNLGTGAIIGIVLGLLSGLGSAVFMATSGGLSVSATGWTWLPTVTAGSSGGILSAILVAKGAVVVLLVALFGGLTGGVLGLLYAYRHPASVAETREQEIDRLMPYAVAYMYSLSVQGEDTVRLFRSMATSEDIFGEIAVEFQRILADAEYMNEPYTEGLKTISKQTPHPRFGQFLSDFLTRINSGGSIENFLEQQKDKMLERTAQQQEQQLEQIEQIGVAFSAASIAPGIGAVMIGLLISTGTLPVPVFFVIFMLPLIVSVFFILIIDVIRPDANANSQIEIPDSLKETDIDGVTPRGDAPGDVQTTGIVGSYSDASGTIDDLFSRIEKSERRYRVTRVLREPKAFFTDYPTLSVIPMLALLIPYFITGNSIGLFNIGVPSGNGFAWVTGLLVVPYIVLTAPLLVFTKLKKRKEYDVKTNMTEHLRMIATFNDAGQSVPEAIKHTAQQGTGQFAKDLQEVYNKSRFNRTLGRALIEFANKYDDASIARRIELMREAMDASDRITDVLNTLASVSETQDRLRNQRVSKLQSQVIVISIVTVVVTAILAFTTMFFLPQILGAFSFGVSGFSQGPTDIKLYAFWFYAGSVSNAVGTGALCGWLRYESLKEGTPYTIAYLIITVLLWAGVYQVI
ncbi:type II secretion system F family protein [Halobaculum sp. MBLA0147]|uniref:type II secretion system F family protein n=1 Tax=Halobaculum sp. MBLA0147 TaxID=3079934 RepID=UPI003523432E